MAAFRSRHRRGGRWWATGTTAAAAIVALVFVMTAGAAKPPPPPAPLGPYQVPVGPVGIAAGFADNDGGTNTGPNPSGLYSPAATANGSIAGQPTFDWNNFAPQTWQGNAAPQIFVGSASGGWTVGGANAPIGNATGQSSFAGGVKQDNNCASVISGGVQNKDDLRAIYVAGKTAANGHTYLELAWERAPQQTTSSSAHVAFEFNQGTVACGQGSDGLVNRVAGDLLVIYDFTGGSTSPPSISLSKWVTAGSCQVGSDSPPCWGTFTVLPPADAEANVDDGLSHLCQNNVAGTCGPNETDVNTGTPSGGTTYTLPTASLDCLAGGSAGISACSPSNTAPTSGGLSLGTSEFGEAGIDLTAAGVFTPGTCETFGQVEGVSRSSGDSSTAAMEKLVGPVGFHLSNCAEIRIVKHTDPRGTNQGFSYSTNVPSGSATGAATFCKTPDSTGLTTTFTLNDSAGSDTYPGAACTPAGSNNIEDILNVQPGSSYTVTETVPSGWQLEALSCSPQSGGTATSFGSQNGTTKNEADITVVAEGIVTCTFQNAPNSGAIVITKAGKYKGCAANSTAAVMVNNSQIGVCSGTAGVAYLGGATFKVTSDQAGTTTVTGGGSLTTSNTTGTVCIDGLSWSGSGTSYYAFETGAPGGYSADPTNGSPATVSVTQNAKCNTGHTGVASGTAATQSFNDIPLTDVTVKAQAETAGATNSTVTCQKQIGTGTPTNIGNSPQGPSDPAEVDVTGLKPNAGTTTTYTCTIVIDP